MKKKIIRKHTKSKHTKSVLSFKKSSDIIELILSDHRPLKKLIKILKNNNLDLQKRRTAFLKFAPLLQAHAQPEEETLYSFLRHDNDFREESFEGEVEHLLADQVLQEVQQTIDKDMWSAKVKVLAELVEHHLKEEEEEIFPNFKKQSSPQERSILGEEYLKSKEDFKSIDESKSEPDQDILDYENPSHSNTH